MNSDNTIPPEKILYDVKQMIAALQKEKYFGPYILFADLNKPCQKCGCKALIHKVTPDTQSPIFEFYCYPCYEKEYGEILPKWKTETS